MTIINLISSQTNQKEVINIANRAVQNEQLQNLVLANTMYFHNLILTEKNLQKKHFFLY